MTTMGMGRVRMKMPEMAVKPPMSLPRYVLGLRQGIVEWYYTVFDQ